MAIPKTISRQNVLDAIREIKVYGIPRQRLPRKWYLSYRGSKYPTKLAISLAHKIAKGRSLDPSKFTGGNESNSFLRRLGFSVCPYTPKEAVTDSIVKELCTAKLSRLSDLNKSVGVVPKESGVYAWYFEGLPPSVPTKACFKRGQKRLLYVGISPENKSSRETLCSRIRFHFLRNAEGSTLRRTIGCLLSKKLRIELRRVGSGKRHTFGKAGEAKLTRWLAKNAAVTWVKTKTPWSVESNLIKALKTPLNIESNRAHGFCRELCQIRAKCLKNAREKPILENEDA